MLSGVCPHLQSHRHGDRVQHVGSLHDCLLIALWRGHAPLHQKDSLETVIGIPRTRHGHGCSRQAFLPLQMLNGLQLPVKRRLVGHNAKAALAIIQILSRDHLAIQELHDQALSLCISEHPVQERKYQGEHWAWLHELNGLQALLQLVDAAKAFQGPAAKEDGIDAVFARICWWILASFQRLRIATQPGIIHAPENRIFLDDASQRGCETQVAMLGRSKTRRAGGHRQEGPTKARDISQIHGAN
mmetsp:Transcript_9581/g.23131  ORF Transcript_9581/g.23131 Transcript_9581/m.23131 type:complete len:244 (+) Transcript_9581:306-1037(+)